MLKLHYYPDPILKQECEPVTDFESIQDEIDQMFKIMYKYKGVGLAAPQAGLLKSFFIANPTPKKRKEGLVFVNPEIISTSGLQWDVEGCLSFPNKFIQKIRPYSVTIKAYNRFGEKFHIEAEGLLARIILHESDHLKGILFMSN